MNTIPRLSFLVAKEVNSAKVAAWLASCSICSLTLNVIVVSTIATPVRSELSGRLCGQYDLKSNSVDKTTCFWAKKAQFWAPLGWFFSHFCPESIYKLRLRNLVDSQTIRNCLQASGIILRPGLFGPDLAIVILWEKIKFFVARLWWLHSLSKIWSLFSLLHKFKLYVY